MFLTNVLNQLICNHENPLYYEIEKNVEISFGTTLEFEKIHFCYVDSRNSQKEITYHTVKSPDPYTFPKIRKEGDPATSTYVEYDSHTILNKPIYHYCEIKYYYEKKGAEQVGGCSVYRNLSREKEQLKLLQKKWGNKIVKYDVNDRSHGRIKKKAFDINPVIKVPIRGI